MKVKFHMVFLWDGWTQVCSNGLGHMTKVTARPIYDKNLKKSSFLVPKSRWPWNLVCSIEYYQVCSNDDPELTLTYFTARSNFWSLKVNKYMNLYEYQRSRSFVDLDPRSLRFTFLNFFCSETARSNFMCSLHGMGKWKFVQMVQVTWPIWPPCPYMIKTLKIFFSGTKLPMTLKTGIQHRVLKYYQVYSNDNPWLTLAYFTARSNLTPYAFVWEKGNIMDSRNYCTVCICDIKVGRVIKPNEYLKLYEYQRSRSFIDLHPKSLRFNIFKFLLLRYR